VTGPASVAAPALLGLYAQPDFVLARGLGSRVQDEDGREYLDFTAGIAVNALGHGSPIVAGAIRDALETGLIHTSNLYRTRPAMELAELLVERTFPGGVFFCNSGAEANEAAIKLALTDRPAYQEPFRPLMPGTHFAEVGDVDGVRDLLASGRVAAVFIEPIQGEGGVRTVPSAFLKALRSLCDDAGALLVFDEVQCGLGRTGTVFAWEQSGVRPDLLTLAKPLAGGLPMGAVVANTRVAETLKPGDHATTFGGGPLVASVALAVLRTICAPSFLEGVQARSAHLDQALAGLRARHPSIVDVRGMGLMRGLQLSGQAGPVVTRAREAGLLLVSAGPDVIRLVPALNIPIADLDAGLAILSGALD